MTAPGPLPDVEMVLASKVAARMRVPVDALLRASERRQFARYHVIGSRKYYRATDIEAGISLLPGDPDQWDRAVAAADAACPAQGRRRRRAAPHRPRESSAPAS